MTMQTRAIAQMGVALALALLLACAMPLVSAQDAEVSEPLVLAPTKPTATARPVAKLGAAKSTGGAGAAGAGASSSCGPYSSSPIVVSMGNDKKPVNVVAIAKEHLEKPADFGKPVDSFNVYVGKEAACAFHQLYEAAKKDGRAMKIRSAFQSAPSQDRAFQCYKSGNCAQPAPMPGHSIYGDATVFNLLMPAYVIEWLKQNGAKFGFVQKGAASAPWIWQFKKGAAAAAPVPEPKVRASADSSDDAAADEPLVLAPTAVVASGCGPYATAASVSQVGNGDKSYSLLPVAKEHLVKPADFGKVHVGKETACAFARMFDAAKKEGRTIKIRAGFRSLPAQKADLECYENLICTRPVPQPGISIFGDGTALNLDVADMQTYQAAPSYEWIKKNGAKFGFAQANGAVEKWTWRFNKGAAQAEPKVRASADSDSDAGVEDIRVMAPGFNPPNRGAPDRTQGAPNVGPRVYPKTPSFNPPNRGAPDRTQGAPNVGPRVYPNKRPSFNPPDRGAPSRTK